MSWWRFGLIRNFSDGMGNIVRPGCWRLYYLPKGARVCSWFIDVQLPWVRYHHA